LGHYQDVVERDKKQTGRKEERERESEREEEEREKEG
jgi:hypothetical protein